MKDLIRIGTCSWKYDSWRGIIYPATGKINYLVEYARHYHTVEIDQWFWSLFGVEKIALPSPKVVKEYLESIPPDFRFTIKVPNSITLTHFYRKSKKGPLVSNPHFLSVELFHQFLDAIEPLRNHLGPLMFQFEYLNKQKMPSQALFMEKCSEFLEKIDRSLPYAFEIRNPNYLNIAYFRFLNTRHLGHVFLQGYYMPPIYSVYDKFKSFLTGETVLRLHGPGRGDIEEKSGGNWNQILEPRDAELKQIAEMIRDLVNNRIRVWVNVNNHYEGSAPLTIQRLEKILGRKQ
ncbi:MAG: hypothetical protein Kow0042_26770 [Calditrichia bacterium]